MGGEDLKASPAGLDAAMADDVRTSSGSLDRFRPFLLLMPLFAEAMFGLSGELCRRLALLKGVRLFCDAAYLISASLYKS